MYQLYKAKEWQCMMLQKPRALRISFLSLHNCHIIVGKECGDLNVMKNDAACYYISRVKSAS